jgi:hypothetical protein
MFARAIRAKVQESADQARVIGSCMAICLLLSSSNLLAQPKKKPSTTPRKTATQETAGADAAVSKAPKKGHKKKDKDKNSVPGVANYSSQHFLVHTDLADDKAEELLERLETMLELISKYWNRPPTFEIEMFVVNDPKAWPPGAIPDEGLDGIAGGAGVTVTRRVAHGDALQAKSVVYAVADRGTPQHEAVHAYCAQAFGRTGPLWYSEGMAEMGHYWRANDASVNAHPLVIRYLHTSPPKSLNEIVNSREYTGDSWQNYAWRWALCHLLEHNTNYSARFRVLGLALLTKQPDASFEQTYGDMAKEISFEYRQFLKNLGTGYRADLCSWDWKAKFKPVKSGAVTQVKIDSGRGWQPSRLTIAGNEEYEYSVAGTWSLSKDTPPVSADGGAQGRGKLIGVLLSDDKRDYALGEPFELGKFGSLKAPAGGNLYLRCRDDWSAIADNRGIVTVRLKLKNKGPALLPPKTDDEKQKTANTRSDDK